LTGFARSPSQAPRAHEAESAPHTGTWSRVEREFEPEPEFPDAEPVLLSAEPVRHQLPLLLDGDDLSGKLSRLREQVQRLQARPAVVRERAPLIRTEPDPTFLHVRTSAPAPHHGAADLPGEVRETSLGTLRSVLTCFPEDHCHGSVGVVTALDASAADVSVLALDPSLANIDFSRALYIDTETTGLAGGSGTIPFLIGMAWFEGRELRVEQLLLERPGLEAPMLTCLAERLRASTAVISFNGKSFDWPLLRTRFILQRVPAPTVPAHLDLLHCSRRVYKRRLGSVRLVHLEEQILGFTRVDDIPGELIPETYLGFVRGRVPGSALAPIIEHNRNDLVALAAILGELTSRFRGERPRQDARDQLGFAGVAARGSDHARAMSFAQGAADADLLGELAPEAHFLTGELCLKAGDVEAAERAFLRSIEAACGLANRAGRAHLALAKLYEHRLKRFDTALLHARGAIAHEGPDAAARRVARLSRKCASEFGVLSEAG